MLLAGSVLKIKSFINDEYQIKSQKHLIESNYMLQHRVERRYFGISNKYNCKEFTKLYFPF